MAQPIAKNDAQGEAAVRALVRWRENLTATAARFDIPREAIAGAILFEAFENPYSAIRVRMGFPPLLGLGHVHPRVEFDRRPWHWWNRGLEQRDVDAEIVEKVGLVPR